MSDARTTYALEGVEAQDRSFLDALARGRLHHAWLLTGPEGSGKASWAHRAARRLLGAAPSRGAASLDADETDPVSRLMAAQAHPDLLVLERQTDAKGVLRKSIAADAARVLPEFFSRSPGVADYRVAIVDSADHLNETSENALLKTLEEPPARGVLFLVSHAPGGLLPTIRSRCRRLAFAPWPEDAVATFVQRRTGVGQDVAHRAATLSGGAPGRALSALGGEGMELDALAAELAAGLPRVDEAAVSTLSDRFRGGEGLARFLTFFERLGAHLRVRATQSGDVREAARWSRAWVDVHDAAMRAEGLNQDRADVLWTVVASLRRAAS